MLTRIFVWQSTLFRYRIYLYTALFLTLILSSLLLPNIVSLAQDGVGDNVCNGC